MSQSRKKLMILGAGPFQVAAIQEAVRLGCHVITVDCFPESVGHRYSHQFANCSTADQVGVLEIAKRFEVDGIMTMASDVAVPTLAFVAEQLALPAPSTDAAAVFTNKVRFRKFQSEHSLVHPLFQAATSADQIEWSRFDGLTELIIKPSDTSGSRGISRVAVSDKAGRERAFREAREFSRTRNVCVEQFIDGLDVTGEGFLLRHHDPVVAFTQKFTRHCVVTGHRLPGMLSAQQQRRALDAILAACDAADYHEGPFDADLRITAQDAVILEMSPRLGGNGCPLLLKAYSGADPIEWTIRLALGESLTRPQLRPSRRGYGSTIIGSDQPGILRTIRTIEQVRTALPYVVEGVWAVRPGDRIERFRHGGNALGSLIFESDTPDDFSLRTQQIREAAGIEVLPQN